jgi:alpha-tubulin suppressor-like RCC1 family protein
MVFSWGANNYGQLGAGSTQQHIDTPQALISIRGIPIAQIITGGNHSFILSMSGALQHPFHNAELLRSFSY